jgi:predicted transposase YdaD
MTELSNPHDKFFKETFSRPEVIRSFLEEYLPGNVSAVLDLNSLELQKDSC